MSDPADRIYERLLVVRAQTGDAAAFAELVERYSPRLRYFLRKLLGGERHRGPERHGGHSLQEEADDLLQDVWLDVLRQLGRLKDPQALAAWLYRIARDRAYGRMRHTRRVEPLDEASVMEPEGEEPFSPEDAARIHAALDQLPPEQREVLVLRFLEAMTYEQIAGVVGCQLGTVRSRIHYGKQALRRLLGS